MELLFSNIYISWVFNIHVNAYYGKTTIYRATRGKNKAQKIAGHGKFELKLTSII